MSSLVDQLRYLILGSSLQLYYMRWPMLLRTTRTAFDFSDSIRMVPYSYRAQIDQQPQQPRNWPQTAIWEASASAGSSASRDRGQPWLTILNINAYEYPVARHVISHESTRRVPVKRVDE
jgi:hypothetical protein